MKNKRPSIFPFILLLLASTTGFAQIDFSTAFQESLQHAQIDFYQPVENSFKKIPIHKNTIQHYDLAIKSKKENLEIRYAIAPISDQIIDDFPPINFTAKAVTIASNDPSTTMAFHPIDQSDIKEIYNADWGAAAFFQPKAEFSTKQHCKMLALYAKGKANVYVFYLFDDLSLDLAEQFQNIRFAD